eukprot:TRINITY_DN47767_c0_g1_i1.p1 TRINITY_DN47767_c0_g1~~TRINITY_DN47767_c0_g1_i1.p1  ORF type:complete len:179 (-),score=18.91 TRINITY_DN47767_c0_g1_i1:55-591(-)
MGLITDYRSLICIFTNELLLPKISKILNNQEMFIKQLDEMKNNSYDFNNLAKIIKNHQSNNKTILQEMFEIPENIYQTASSYLNESSFNEIRSRNKFIPYASQYNVWERPTSNYEIPILKNLVYKIALFIDQYLPNGNKTKKSNQKRDQEPINIRFLAYLRFWVICILICVIMKYLYF